MSSCQRESSSPRAKRRRQQAAPKQARCILSDPAAAAIKPDARCGSCAQFSGCFMALADCVVTGQTRNGASSSADRECDDDEGPSETLPRAKCRRVGVEEEYPEGVTETKNVGTEPKSAVLSASCRAPVLSGDPGPALASALPRSLSTVSTLQK